jgi:hypothetical protein
MKKRSVNVVDITISRVPTKRTQKINISLAIPFLNACSCVLLNPKSIYLELIFKNIITIASRNLLSFTGFTKSLI